MKLQAKAGATNYAALDDGDSGEGLSIFFSQGAADVVRWKLEVYAQLDNHMNLLVGSMVVSPPSAVLPRDQLTRCVAMAVCPGAISWSVVATPASGPQTAANEDAQIHLFSSKCCTSPVGLTRVNQRYGYIADSAAAPQTLTLLPGQTVTGIGVVGLTGGGTLTLLGGSTITVPAGVGLNLEPKAPIAAAVNALSFVNVDWVVEFLESA